jgi:hypothetical protein
MQTTINEQISEAQENNSKGIMELISKDDLNGEDLESLKDLIITSDIKIQSKDQGFSLTPIGYTIRQKSDDLNFKLLELLKLELKDDKKLSELKALIYKDGSYDTAFGYAFFLKRRNIALELAKDQKLSEVKAQVSPGEGYVTAIGYAIFNNKLEELLESFPAGLEEGEKLSEVKALVYTKGNYLTATGYAISNNKLDKLLESFPTRLEAGEKLSEVKAKVFPNGAYLTATGYAISDNKLDKLLESFPTRLEAAERLSEMKAMVYPNRYYLTAFGYAILDNKLDKLLELFPTGLEEGERLSEVKAQVFQDEKYLNLLQYSIEKLKIDSVKLLIERDPSSVNSETVINGKSALKYATSLYQDNRDANSKASLISIIKILLENGANFRIIELYCPQPIKTEIDKIKENKKIYYDDLGVISKILQSPTSDEIDDKINIEYFKFLFKQSGIPEHLMQIKERYPHSKISGIIEEFKRKEEVFLQDLDVRLGDIVKHHSGEDQIVLGYNALQKFLEDEKTRNPDHEKKPDSVLEKFREFYELNPQFKTNDFIEKNDIDTIRSIMFTSGNVEWFLEQTKDLILSPKNHPKLKDIRKALLSIDPLLDRVVQNTTTALLDLKDRFNKQEERIVELKTQNSELKISNDKNQERIAELETNKVKRSQRILALEELLSQLIRTLPSSSVRENISIANTSNEASVGQKRPREESIPSNQPGLSEGSKALKTGTLSKSKS